MIEKNEIITFSDDEKVIILDLIKFNDIVYSFVNELAKEDEEPTDSYYIMRYDEEKDEMFKVLDKTLLDKLMPIFNERIQKLLNVANGE